MNNKNKNFKSRVRRKIISDTFRTWGLGMPSLMAGAINLWSGLDGVNGDY